MGMKSGRRHFIQLILNLHLLMMRVRHPYSVFSPEIIHCNEKNNAIRCALILYFLKPIIPFSSPSQWPESIIPLFHHSNRTTLRLSTGWGEAPNLKTVAERRNLNIRSPFPSLYKSETVSCPICNLKTQIDLIIFSFPESGHKSQTSNPKLELGNF
jgi:hypothetical protein